MQSSPIKNPIKVGVWYNPAKDELVLVEKDSISFFPDVFPFRVTAFYEERLQDTPCSDKADMTINEYLGEF